VDVPRALAVVRAVSRAVNDGLVHSVHAPSRGGLGVGFAKVAFGGELGMSLALRQVPASGVTRDDELLFSESNSRYIITVPPSGRAAFERALADVPFACVGTVTAEPRLVATGLDGRHVLDANVLDLKARWKAPLDAI
jgi:phosphoribosylformylglycinamidine synthase